MSATLTGPGMVGSTSTSTLARISSQHCRSRPSMSLAWHQSAALKRRPEPMMARTVGSKASGLLSAWASKNSRMPA